MVHNVKNNATGTPKKRAAKNAIKCNKMQKMQLHFPFSALSPDAVASGRGGITSGSGGICRVIGYNWDWAE